MPNETERLIELVRNALDEFETASLSASVRRALRIAQLRGDAEMAWFFRLDLRPMGGSKTMQRGELQAIWPETDYVTWVTSHNALLEEWMLERKPNATIPGATTGEESILGGSVSEIEAQLALREGTWREEFGDDVVHKSQLDRRAYADRSILERIRQRVYFYLCRCETELAVGGIAANVFDRHRRRVDETLSAVAPEILEQFAAAHRRASDGDSESRAHALTSCRRILKAVADVVFPPRNEPFTGKDGKERIVDDERYKNRLLAFL